MDEVITDWTTPAGGGMVTVHYVAETTTPVYRLAWSDFLTAIKGQISPQATWSIRGSGRQIDAETGALTGEWVGSTAITGTGTATGQILPDASQALLRWGTGVVANGRFLKGRTFIPGFTSNAMANGNFTPATVSVVDAALRTFLTASGTRPEGPGLLVWKRPVAGGGGTNARVTTGTCWSEVSVLRSRRA